MADVSEKSTTVFGIWFETLEARLKQFWFEIGKEIETLRALGFSDEDIFNELSQQLRNRQGIFTRLKGIVESAADKNISVVTQIRANEEQRKSSRLWVWVLDPTVKNHCEDCLRNSKEEPHPFEWWEKLGLPAYGTTACKQYCHCTIMPKKD